MEPRSQEYLDQIFKKELNTLNDQEIAFLRARRSYLKRSQLEEYDSILNPQEESEVYVSKKDKNQTSEEEPVKENGESQETK